MSMNVNNTYVTECICALALFYCTLYVTQSRSVTLAFSFSSHSIKILFLLIILLFDASWRQSQCKERCKKHQLSLLDANRNN